MVTHVSRRGVRDHFGSFHQGGLYEYHNGFDALLETKRFKSGLGVKLEQDTKDAYVAESLKLEERASREEALSQVDRIVNETGWSSFADHSAVHFATEAVADAYYGTERGNEHFVDLPSVLIAAQYEFGGYHGQGLEKASGDFQRNDLWVWEKDKEGIPIDAGVVFLPADTQVDPETGSRYALTENKQAVVNVDVMGWITLCSQTRLLRLWSGVSEMRNVLGHCHGRNRSLSADAQKNDSKII